MSDNPIQQLVDAAKFAQSFLLWNNPRRSQIDAAIAAVESAQVETRWMLERNITDGVHRTFFESQEAAKKWASPDSIGKVVRLDTYRTVESDQ